MQRSQRIANVLLLAPALYGVTLTALALWKYRLGATNSVANVASQGVLGLIITISFIAARRLRPSAKGKLVALTLSSGASLLLAECALRYLQRSPPYATQDGASAYRAGAADKLGQAFDQRSKREVVAALRASGVPAIPAFHPEYFYLKGLSLRIGGTDVVPLGGVAECPTVFCNESGQYLVYDSDEHGFNNPKGLYVPGKVDIAVVGDSFTQGACVCTNKNLVSYLRERHAATLNLGNAGDGPLCELATLAEYGQPLRPRTVIWCYYEGNDLLDLSREKKSVLLHYLEDPKYSAGLMSRQVDIDRELRRIIDAELANPPSRAEDVPADSQGAGLTVSSLLTLGRLRGGVAGLLQATNPAAFPQSGEIPLLRQVLQAAQARTESAGGRFYFVYLPAYERYGTRGYSDKPYACVKALVAELGLPFIDVRRVFDRQGDAVGLFPLRIWGHYTEAGYQLAAETILQNLD
jgi:hypothetical protein